MDSREQKLPLKMIANLDFTKLERSGKRPRVMAAIYSMRVKIFHQRKRSANLYTGIQIRRRMGVNSDGYSR